MKVTITSHSPAPRPFLSALIGGVGGLLSQGINAISQAATNKQQIKASKEMQQQQHENALAQMQVAQQYSQENMKLADAYNQAAEQRANEYNSMGAQMHRADQAGVSRLAALGQSTGQTISQMNAPSSSPAGAVGGSPGSLRAPMFDLTGLSRAVAEIENIKSDTKLKDQDARLRSYQADEAEFQKRMQPVRQAILQKQSDKADAEAKLAKLDALRKEIFVGENGENAQREYDAFITKLENEGTMTHAQADAYRAEGNLKEEQAKTEGTKRSNIVASTKLLESQRWAQELENRYRKMSLPLEFNKFKAEVSKIQSEANISAADAATRVIENWVRIGSMGVEAASQLLSVFLPSKAVSDIIASLGKRPGPVGYK